MTHAKDSIRSSKKRGRASADRPPAGRFLDALPEPICTQLREFLPQWGVFTLMDVSKDTQQAVLLALRAWEYSYAGYCDQDIDLCRRRCREPGRRRRHVCVFWRVR